MSSEPVIRLSHLGKCYQIYDKPRDRLLQMLSRGRKQYYREFWALKDINLEVMPGEVLGIIGCNGSGKSTLLQLICGTLTPTTGEIMTRGRVAALLELGAGFNPEFSGRENVFLSAAVIGLSKEDIVDRYEEIVAFSGVRNFIDQPVKTYSSGMYVRLAFSIATSVDPDILVIDEALSVGDGEFARKSFDRIMSMKKAGKTILFCSHSMYQIEAMCGRAIWLDQGCMRDLDWAARVTNAYQASMDAKAAGGTGDGPALPGLPRIGGRILKVYGSSDGVVGTVLRATSRKSTVEVTVEFVIDPELPLPSVALVIINAAGIAVTSAGSANDGVALKVNTEGRGRVTIIFHHIPLLKGEYSVTVYLACENTIHLYDCAENCLTLRMDQHGLAQGMVDLPHEWKTGD